MIEQHYGDARCSRAELDALISDARSARTGTYAEPLDKNATNDVLADEEFLTNQILLRERATGVEPATSSLGMGPKRKSKTSIGQGNS